MKLLFDQNISFRVAAKIQDIFPGSIQVREVSLENSKDTFIWEYARTNGYCIVTFDSDFYDMGLIRGTPPKIIWLRTGNTKTSNIEKIIRNNFELISSFISDPFYNNIECLEIKQ